MRISDWSSDVGASDLFTTQRREPDRVRILSGLFEGRTTGTPISLMIDNVDQRSKDYGAIAGAYRPGHADYAYDRKSVLEGKGVSVSVVLGGLRIIKKIQNE